ncbi:MAG TPA: phosphate regulon sensor histidine kinase PhoR [Rhodocyclaceae bacterium]
MQFWLAVLLRLLAVAVPSAAVAAIWGLDKGFVLSTLLLALLLGVHLRRLYALQFWLRSDGTDVVPEAAGLWGDVFATLYHNQKAQARDKMRLMASLERFRMAGSALPDGVVILDRDNRIEWCNHVAEAQYGLDLERDIGTPVAQLIRHPDFAAFVADSSLWNPLMLRLARNGTCFAVSLIPFAEDGRLLLSRDVTQIERTDTIRRDFVANVSHELRTPLTVILGFLEHLVDDADLESTTRQRFLGMVLEQVERMNRLVDDLLTLSRLESSPEPVGEEEVDVGRLVREVVEEGRALSQGQHVIEAEVGCGSLRGSLSELRSAFGNLVSNAVRYTPQGGKVLVKWYQAEDGSSVFSVADSGIGIPTEHIPRLTERFYRVDKGRSANTGGTGLGLAIVKHVLQHHQAALDIRSTPGEGSVFRAVFPARRTV